MNINQTFEQAIKLHREGKLKEAELLYRSILEIQPEHLDSNNNLGTILKDNGRLEDAKKYYEKAIDIKPDFAEAYNNLGCALKDLAKLNEAEVNFNKAIEFKPDLAEAHNNLGDVLIELGKIDEAIASYKKAIESKPNYTKAHVNLSNMLIMRNRLEEAETYCKKAIELIPDYAEAYNTLGVIVQKLSRFEEAETNYIKAIEIKPDFTEAYCNLGSLMSDLERLDEALVNCNKAIEIANFFKDSNKVVKNNNPHLEIELNPNYEKPLLIRGSILFKKKNFELALLDLDNCTTEASRLITIYSLFALGRIKEVYERIEKNSELDEGCLKISAFSSFISHREKKVTAHKFCNNPIDFIYSSNLSKHLKNSDLFIADVIEELKNIKTRWSPQGKTTKKGFQSFENLFEKPNGKLKTLNSIIIDELDSYYLKFKNEECSYIKKWPSKKRLHGWFVKLKQQGYQASHIHAGGWLSGVIYLKVVPHLGKNEGAIELSLNDDNYSDPNSLKVIHQPKVGDIILFPSNLHHKTIPFTADVERISIAFDLWRK